MDINELRILAHVLNYSEGAELISIILNKLGTFENFYNLSLADKEIFRTLGKREVGNWLLQQCYLANKDKYLQILNENLKEN